jgi:hypothetical protein
MRFSSGLGTGHGIGAELGSVVAREGVVGQGVGFLEKTGQGKWEMRMNRGNSNLWGPVDRLAARGGWPMHLPLVDVLQRKYGSQATTRVMKSDNEFLSEFPQQQAVNLRTSQSTFGAIYPFAPCPKPLALSNSNLGLTNGCDNAEDPQCRRSEYCINMIRSAGVNIGCHHTLVPCGRPIDGQCSSAVQRKLPEVSETRTAI